MTAVNDSVAPVRPFVISREFNAPRELVWKAWTEPEHMKQWWGPKGAVVGYIKMDLRVGGTHHYCMRFAEQEIWGLQYYREIIERERMVFVNSFSDEHGGTTRHPMSPAWPLELLTTVTFKEHNGRTTVTIEWIPINATAAEIQTFDEGRASMNQGWGGTLDQLADYMARH
jgi:uncharacterized protein YndB with AHSA1/START domain